MLYLPTAAFSQQWSAEQQEVLDYIQDCWDAWETKVFDNWIDVCKPTQDGLWWDTRLGLPHQDVTFSRKTAEAQWRTSEIEYLWDDLRPLDVQFHGDVALVYSYVLFSWKEDGKVLSSEEKRFEVFRKVDGQWTVLGGMTVPVDDD